MQIMPLPDGAGAVFGCMILLTLAGAFVTAIVAIVQGVLARKRKQPERAAGVRVIGAATFAFALALIAFESHYSYVQPKWRFAPLAALALVAIAAWLTGIFAASKREIAIGTMVASGGIIAVAAVIAYDANYRTRRERLFAAAERGDAAEVRAMLATGLSPNLRDDVGVYVIRKAKNATTAAALLDAGADIRSAWPALAAAAQSGDLALATTLMSKGVSPGNGEHSASRIAWENGHMDVLEAFRRAGDRDAERYQQRTGILIRAVQAGDLLAVQGALAGDYLDQERRDGLRIASSRGARDITLALAAATTPYTEIAGAAVRAAKHGHVALFGELLVVLDQRQAGFIIRETKAAALAEAPVQNEELLRLTATEEWHPLPPPDDPGVQRLREEANRI